MQLEPTSQTGISEMKSKHITLGDKDAGSPRDKLFPIPSTNHLPQNVIDKLIVRQDGTIKTLSDIEVSTRTAIVYTNLKLNLEKLYTYVPVVKYVPQEKRRGRKKRINIEPPIFRLPFGSVVNVQYESRYRGYITPKKLEKRNNALRSKQKRNYFLHCVTMMITIENDDSLYGDNAAKHVKVGANGKLQITGCKNDKHYHDIIVAFFRLLDQIKTFTGEDVVTNREECPQYKAVFNTVMQNMDFYIGFGVVRDNLDQYIHLNTGYRTVYEGSVNPSINIKIPNLTDDENKLLHVDYDPTTGTSSVKTVPFGEYKHHFVKHAKKKESSHSFLVFASGRVIFTSCGAQMEEIFNQIIHILLTNREHFEEIKEVEETTA